MLASRSRTTAGRAVTILLTVVVVAMACAVDEPSAEEAVTSAPSTSLAVGDTAASTVDRDQPEETTAGATPAVDAEPGPTTLDDPYVGTFGNGGYDIGHYDLAIQWFPDRSRLEGVTTITATATQDLSSFNLELVGLEVETVTVDGTAAAFDHPDPELVVTPNDPLAEGAEFEVVIAYGGTPVENGPNGASGWHTRSGYSYVAGEPLAASTFHPANDHPIDKASFTYRITAPATDSVAASGTLVSTTDATGPDGEVTTWVFEQPDPQTTYLTTILIGPFETVDGGTSESGIEVRNVIDEALVEVMIPILADQPAMIDAFEELFGPYPFDLYGSAVVTDSIGGALETQTLSIYGADVMGFGDFTQRIVAHELAHQWFGNHVSLARWGDIWLNEGFASYAEALWAEASDPTFSYQAWIQEVLFFGPELEHEVHDPDNGLFAIQVYQRGALTLHALRLQVGDETFFELLQTWVERYGGGNATSQQFEDLAEELSGQELDDFFDAWLRAEALPAELDGVVLDTGS